MGTEEKMDKNPPEQTKDPKLMTDTEKLDLLLSMMQNFTNRLEALERKTSQIEDENGDSGELWGLMSSCMGRLGALEQKSLEEVPKAHGISPSLWNETMSSMEQATLGLERKTRQIDDEIEGTKAEMKDLKQRVNDLGCETARLTKNTIARESLERNDEAKNVAVYNITEDLIKPHRRHTNSEDEAIGSCLRQIAKRTIENLDDRDIRSVRRISSKGPSTNSPRGSKSAIITFVSVGDAQKFESRLNQAVMGPGRTTRQSSGNHGTRNKRKMNARTGLTTLQRSLLTEAETMTSIEDTQPRDMRRRRQNIMKLTDWRQLETPKEVESHGLTSLK